MELVFLMMFVLVVLHQISSRSLQEEQEEQEEEEISAVLIEVQKYGDQIYFWDKETGDFIIQGRDMNDIVAKCKKYFPERYFCIEQEDIEKYNLKVDEATVA
jgi:hypothetical protein